MFNRFNNSINKLVKIYNINKEAENLREQGHSAFASFMGAALGAAAGSATFAGGAGLMAAGAAAAPEAPPVAAAAFSAGFILMNKSEEAAKITQQTVPVLVDNVLDGFSDLYSSAAQFVTSAYQKYMADESFSKKPYVDMETLMLDLGYSEHAKKLYEHLNENQQLIYATVARDLFNEQFKYNQDQTVRADKAVLYKNVKVNIDAQGVVKDLASVEDKIKKQYSDTTQDYAKNTVTNNNKKLKSYLPQLVKEANQAAVKKQPAPKAIDPVKQAKELCDVLYATGQGVALVARITGNHRLAQQVTQSAFGVSQVVMGIAQIAKGGWAAGPVGMALGGINTLIGCFSSDDSGKAMEALAEQLALISSQIHALHEDMLLQFGKVFTALGVINTNIIEGFRLLHEDQQKILSNVLKLVNEMASLLHNVNEVGHRVNQLHGDLQGYVLEDDRKQLQLVLNEAREKSKRPFNRLKLHPQIMSAFRTLNEELITKRMNAEKVTSADVSRSLSIKLGSAEANAGLLLNYAKQVLGMSIKQPIADPEQWRQSADLLIELVEKTSKEKQDMEVIGVHDYEDFKHLKQIGVNWLTVIEQMKSGKMAELFQNYRRQVNHLITLIEKEIKRSEDETAAAIPSHQGEEQFKKQQEFNFNFQQNQWYQQHTADWSGCKGFNNPARFLGSYCPGWDTHVAARKKDIARRLVSYQAELATRKASYATQTLPYFLTTQPVAGSSSSGFIISEVSSDTMPMLPLPMNAAIIPSSFLEAELLNLGKLKHTYLYEKNEFIYKILYLPVNEKKPIVIRQYHKVCTLPSYLNPAEAAWYAYMGGEYPSNGSYSLEKYGALYTPNGDYYAQSYCATPTMGTFNGIRQKFDASKEPPKIQAGQEVEDAVANQVKQKKAELKNALNERVIQHLESLDSRNVLGTALLEADASAKVLIAFLSILFRESYQRPAVVWTRDDIIAFVKRYQNQKVYLSHQLAANLEVLDQVEKVILQHLALQTESAYTPVRETLKKLTYFMNLYERHVVSDNELAAKEKAESNKEATMYGAAQATLLLQTELINSGHIDAAMHIAQLLARSGLGFLSLPTAANAAQAGYARHRLYPANPGPAEEDGKKDEKMQLGKK